MGQQRSVKCAYCGREDVEVTKKGYMRPHVTPGGLRCIGVNIPGEQSEWGRKKKIR